MPACSCSKTRWAKRVFVPVVTRLRADARRIKEFLGKAFSSCRDMVFGLRLTGRLRRLAGRGGIIVKTKYSTKAK